MRRIARTCAAYVAALLPGAACVAPAPAEPASAAAFHYVLTWDVGTRVLHGTLHTQAATAGPIEFATAAEQFLARDPMARAARAESSHREWSLDLRAASATLDDVDRLAERGHGITGSLALLLPIPRDSDDAARFTLRVQAPAGEHFVCACAEPADGEWRGTLGELRTGPAFVLGALAVRTIDRDATRITVVELLPRSGAAVRELDEHVRTCADAVADWFGRFPVERLLLRVLPAHGATIGSGSARGHGGACITVAIPPRLHRGAFLQDWVLIHEMVHLAVPSLPAAQHWFEEGVATYMEPWIQAAARRVPVEHVWAAMHAEYAQGLAEPERGGLDDDASWGRTYYGGACFCLLADLRIRERTAGRHSLRDALRAVLDAGLDIRDDAPLTTVLALGDAATGTTVLRELYAAMGNRPFAIDLDALWRELGVRVIDDRVQFADDAPRAALRRSFTPAAAR